LRAATSLACLVRDLGRSGDAASCLRLIYKSLYGRSTLPI